MDIRIIKTTEFAGQILKAFPTGRVHSVYRKTINMAFGPWLLALQSWDSPVGPLSLIMEENAGNPGTKFPVGALCQYEDQRILVCLPPEMRSGIRKQDSLSIEPGNAGILPSSLSQADPVVLKGLPACLQQVLDGCATSGFRRIYSETPAENAMEEDLILMAAKRRIREGEERFAAGDFSRSADEFAHLLGLGIGLTPSGDDYLCGMLAGGILSGREEHPFMRQLAREIWEHLQDTNAVSASCLRCALENHFSQAVVSLETPAAPDTLLQAFLAIGHSSGTDTLCGVMESVRLFTGLR